MKLCSESGKDYEDAHRRGFLKSREGSEGFASGGVGMGCSRLGFEKSTGTMPQVC